MVLTLSAVGQNCRVVVEWSTVGNKEEWIGEIGGEEMRGVGINDRGERVFVLVLHKNLVFVKET